MLATLQKQGITTLEEFVEATLRELKKIAKEKEADDEPFVWATLVGDFYVYQQTTAPGPPTTAPPA